MTYGRSPTHTCLRKVVTNCSEKEMVTHTQKATCLQYLPVRNQLKVPAGLQKNSNIQKATCNMSTTTISQVEHHCQSPRLHLKSNRITLVSNTCQYTAQYSSKIRFMIQIRSTQSAHLLLSVHFLRNPSKAFLQTLSCGCTG